MESQLPRTHGHHYEPTDLSTNPSALHSGVEGHSEGHHEKPSVLKKVKEKAKKIKNTLTKHGHGHEHEHDYDHGHDEYEEDEDEEMVEDPEIHGAPIYESAAVRDATRASSGHPAGGGTDLDKPSGGASHYDSTKFTAGGTNLDRPSGGPSYDSTKPTAGGTNLDRPLMGPYYDSTESTPHYDFTKPTAGGTNLDRPYDFTKPTAGGTNFDRTSTGGPHYDSTKPIAGGNNLDRPSLGAPHSRYDLAKPSLGRPDLDRPSMGAPRYDSPKPTEGGTNLDMPSKGVPHYDSPFVDPETRPFVQWQADEEHGKHLLKEDKHAPLPCKLVDTRSGEDLYPELPHKGINTRTGRDVREERENPDQVRGQNAMEGICGGIGTTGFEVDPQGPNIRAHPSNVQVKTIDPAGRGSEEAEGITPVIKSFNKMGISEEKPKTGQGEGLYTGSHYQFAPEPVPREGCDSVTESYNADKPEDVPGDIYDPARQSSTYTEKITSASAAAASAIAGTAQSAKNVIATKIEQIQEPGEGNMSGSPMPHESSGSIPKSYNADNDQDMLGDIYDPASRTSTYTDKITSAPAAAASAIAGTAVSAKNVIASKVEQMREPGEGNKSGSVTGTASDYAHRIAATVTDTLAPVYGKVVGAASGATSKVSGAGAETSQETGDNAGQDEGVSVREYWVEKLKPGEEDRVLSSMITDSFSKPKGEKMEEAPRGGGGGRSISQIVSDAVHKREPEESERKPMGKVTESEEVAKRLGTGEEGTGLENVGTGAGVINKFTGAIGSWLGGQGGRAQSTPGTTLADDNEGDMKKNPDPQEQGVSGERRLQESSN